eukprot:TRINITY_DN4167_c0_g1_i5.p1 TRINITY_DN4167_c0_g1~~TRINITY_DN4167_c0_g1_i5.p1  ORF type:complete len:342 (-),score=71.91 TRINITY_DN4167_c0_g1_i5:116-1141(-)
MILASGEVPVTYKGVSYNCTISILFPSRFPDLAPIVQFFNRDSKRFKVHPKYKAFATPDDRIIALFYSESINWSQHKDVLRVLKQIENEFSSTYPIYDSLAGKPAPQLQSTTSQLNSLVESVFVGSKVTTSTVLSPKNSVVESNGNELTARARLMMKMSTVASEMKNKLFANPFESEHDKLRKLRTETEYNIKKSLQQTTANLVLQITAAKQEANHLFNRGEALEMKCGVTKECLDNIDKMTKEAETENKELESLIAKDDEFVLTKENINNYIQEEEPFSNQIIELEAERKAIFDLLYLLENSCKNDEITFEQYIKFVREYSTREFLNRELCRKAIGSRRR